MPQKYAVQAITTRFLGPTNHRGPRVKARSYAASIVVPWDYGLNPFDNHRATALALAAKLNWSGPWVGGALHSGDYAFVVDVDTPGRKPGLVLEGDNHAG